MFDRIRLGNALPAVGSAFLLLQTASGIGAEGWLHWRGPNQNGSSDETGLPSKLGEPLWSDDMQGRGAPVVADGRVYSWGYKGSGDDLREYLSCLDAETGEAHWRIPFNDFLSDTVYSRYSIGSPTVDPETGWIYLMTTANEMVCVTPGGEIVWRESLLERFGAMTFPNGRRGAPVIDQDLVIHHAITSYWGADGPARDRFLAFDKRTGELVWSSTPGIGPKDSSFSSPVLGWANGKRVLYSGTGCGNVVCVNVRTGEPIWRYHLSKGGVNSSVLVADDRVVAISGKENVDDTGTGRMVAIQSGLEGDEQLVLTQEHELWRNNDLSMFTSSPILVDDRIFQITNTGELVCVDLESGKIEFTHKLGTSQIHASPLFADGKIYAPIVDGNFYILALEDDGVRELDKKELEGDLLGAPVAYNGRVFVHSQEKLYCFGSQGDNPGLTGSWPRTDYPEPGDPATIQIIPSDVVLNPDESQSFRARALDANGFVIESLDAEELEWASFIPPTARVRTSMNGSFNEEGELVAGDEPYSSAGAFKATSDIGSAVIRGRVLPEIPFTEDFERFDIEETYPSESVHAGVEFAYPPLSWIGARFKWDIRELEGEKVLAKTLDNVLFQRAISFFGDPDASDYTMEVDVMTDGNRRMRSNVGVIHQRYFIYLVGNAQLIEVSSNHERLKEATSFRWDPGTWYRFKTQVEVDDAGVAHIRAKAWERGSEEPEAWTLEVAHPDGHPKGAPGLVGFSPQSRYSVYVDNVSVTESE